MLCVEVLQPEKCGWEPSRICTSFLRPSLLMLGEGAPDLPPKPQPDTGHPINTFPILSLTFVFGDSGLARLLPDGETQQVPGSPLFGQKNK